MRIVQLAQIVPHRRSGWDDVGVIAAVGNHVVRALLQPEVLAPVIPADVHELDRVERAAAAPRRTGGMCAPALEAEEHGYEAVAGDVAPRGREVIVHV